jgi:UDP-N-acetylglucosamine acyltransferase
LIAPFEASRNFMISPTAVIHPKAQVGADCVIGPYCVIGEHVTLGKGCRLHSHVVIDGHTALGDENEIFPFASIGLKTQDLKWKGGVTRTRIGDRNTFREYVTIHSASVIMSNGATLAGHIRVEDHVVIGGLAAVHQFCRIGTMSIIGGCSKVVKDVLPYMMADGNPLKTHGINREGLKRNGISEEAQAALKQAHRIIFREKLTLPNALSKIESEVPPLPEIKHLAEFARATQRGISK